MTERSKQNCCNSLTKNVFTTKMMQVIPSGISLICFLLMAFKVTASPSQNRMLSQSTEDALHRLNVPTRIRSGVGTLMDQQEAQKELEKRNRIALKRAIANEAVKHAETAKLVFAFKHNYLVPDSVQEMLPSDFRSKIPHVDLRGQELTLARTALETRHLLRALSHINHYGFDLEKATEHPDLKLVRMINESGLNPELSPTAQAKVFFRLALKLTDYEDYGMSREEANHLKAELMQHAAKTVSSTMNDYTVMFSEDSRNDAVLSTSQLLYWASLREPDMGKRLTLTVDALESLKNFHVNRSEEKWIIIYNDLVNNALAHYKDLLMAMKPGLNEKAVNRFVYSFLSTY